MEKWWSRIQTRKCFTIYFGHEDGTLEPTINTVVGPAKYTLFTHNNNIYTCLEMKIQNYSTKPLLLLQHCIRAYETTTEWYSQ